MAGIEDNKCEFCIYCEVVDKEKKKGICRINPPTLLMSNGDNHLYNSVKTEWPTVVINKDWCGRLTKKQPEGVPVPSPNWPLTWNIKGDI